MLEIFSGLKQFKIICHYLRSGLEVINWPSLGEKKIPFLKQLSNFSFSPVLLIFQVNQGSKP